MLPQPANEKHQVPDYLPVTIFQSFWKTERTTPIRYPPGDSDKTSFVTLNNFREAVEKGYN